VFDFNIREIMLEGSSLVTGLIKFKDSKPLAGVAIM
jgi:hypothetical protein